MKTNLASFVCGLVFASGLTVSGMTLPSKVTGFLDFAGEWDASMALVMGAALAVLVAARALTPARPVFAQSYAPLSPGRLDARLLVGASLFGIGWGLSGFCPGPAIVALGSGTHGALLFVPAMLAGMALQAGVARLTRTPTPPNACG